jgi:DNA-directed RNA polymerase subunit RPC12/RpoP
MAPIAILMLFFLVATPAAAMAQEDILILNDNEDGLPTRPPVAFPHDLHMGLYDCLTCHHDFDGETNVLDEDELYEGNENISCAACHGPGDQPDLQKAFHYQCMGCHIEVRKSGKGSGPELCGACHIPQ